MARRRTPPPEGKPPGEGVSDDTVELPDVASQLARAVQRAASERIESPDSARSEIELMYFRVCDHHFAVPVEDVLEVVAPEAITEVPHAPPHIRGVFNRHGLVTAVLDLALFAGLDVEETPRRLVVVQSGDLEAAIPVTEVIGLRVVGEQELQPPLMSVAGRRDFVSRQIESEAKTILVLDSGRLLGGSQAGKRPR
jgi:purine-binding chemotaxis protein CheW